MAPAQRGHGGQPKDVRADLSYPQAIVPKLPRLSFAFTLPFVVGAAMLVAPGCGASSTHEQGTVPDASKPATHDASKPDVKVVAPHDAADSTHHDATVAPDAPASDTCNGHLELCGRSYNQVTFPGTHGSYADTSEGFEAPDQTYPIARQLTDGIRVLHLELHIYSGDVYACHSICQIGSRLFADEMKSIVSFVVAHPREVVTILLERSDATITADNIGDVMKMQGIGSFMHIQTASAPWPTLGQMIASGDRVVALLDNPTGSSYAWLLPRWQLTWETPWDNTTPADFGQCNADRGMMGDGVYVVDTYMEDLPIESAAHAALVNYDPFLIERLLFCKQTTSTLPNFAMVNFYEVSDVFSVVDVLNGFAPTPDVDLSTFPPSAWPSDGGIVDASAGDAGSGSDAKVDGSLGIDAASDAIVGD